MDNTDAPAPQQITASIEDQLAYALTMADHYKAARDAAEQECITLKAALKRMSQQTAGLAQQLAAVQGAQNDQPGGASLPN